MGRKQAVRKGRLGLGERVLSLSDQVVVAQRISSSARHGRPRDSFSRVFQRTIDLEPQAAYASRLQGVFPAKPEDHRGKTAETQLGSKVQPSIFLTLSISHRDVLLLRWILRAVSWTSVPFRSLLSFR
jgi:hypothetical protein